MNEPGGGPYPFHRRRYDGEAPPNTAVGAGCLVLAAALVALAALVLYVLYASWGAP